MENMVVEVPPQVRLVRCPKCRNLLPEPPGVPLYSCGGCGTFLQAKTKKRSDAGKTGVDPHDEKGFPNDINELRREENAVASPEEDSSSNKIALKTEKQSSAFALDREESSCREKTEATGEDNSCSNQSLSLESGSSNSELVENVFDPPHHDDDEEQKEYAERLSLYQSMEAAVDISSSVSIANIEHPHEGNEAKENGCCSNQSLQIEDDTAAMDYLSPRAEPLVEEEEENRNCDDEVEVEATVADNVSSDQSIGTVNQMVAASNVSTSDIIIVQEAAQNDGSNRSSSFNAKETARETICQETISSFAMEEQFQNLDTYVGVRRQELNVGISNVSEMQPTRRTHNEELELLRSGEEIFFISKEEKKLREELLLLNHQTPDDDSVSEMLMIKGLDPVIATHQTRHRTRSESYNQGGSCYGEGASNQEREKFLYRSKLHSEQDKTELLRIMVLQLEAQVRRMRHSGHSTSETETVSVEMNRFYSETLDRPRTQFSQPYSFPSSGFSSPQQPRRYYSPSRSWDFETNSVDQLSSNSKFSYQQRKRVHVPKRHVRAVAGGSPVITCYRCLAMLLLPEDFLLSKRKRFHWLKCGSCLTVLRFSLQNGTHIIPYREGGGYDENRKKGTEARRNRSSALHKLMGYSSVTQLVIRSGESSPSDQTSV